MKLEPGKTAVLSLDFQDGIFGFVPGAEAGIANAATTVDAARTSKFKIIHVGLGFEPGYPEIGVKKSRFAMLKERGLFRKGSDSAAIHKSISRPDELVVYKHRVSAFSGNSLALILKSQAIENLVLFGIATSGIVLSTLREASDLDFNCTVIKDACFDSDPEVHRVLTEKVFAAQANVVTAEVFRTQCCPT
jgi:nicotinamidase-related amidase